MFRLYQASLNLKTLLTYNEMFPDKTLNVLRSFAMLDKENKAILIKHRDKIDSLILEPGTYTVNMAASKPRTNVNVETYKDFLLRFGDLFDFYFNFDIDFTDDGFETNLYNQRVLEDAGLSPVPIIHNIYSDETTYYIEQGYDRIALGSPQIRSVKDLEHVMSQFEGTKIKVHLLGNTGYDYLTMFPLNSVDSTMWARAGGFGDIYYWNPKKEGANKTDKIYMEEYLHADAKKLTTFTNYEFQKDLILYLKQELGITYQDLMGSEGSYFKRLVNIHHYVKLEERVNRIHKQKGFI